MDGLIGEAWAGESPDGCHVNVVLAERGSPTAAGAAQLGVGQGVLDAVAEGRLPADGVVVLAVIWLDPEAGDETAVKRSSREAMRTAIADALEPADARELIERREVATNGFYGGG
jgi:formaldehyde-activating enzyme